MAPTNPFQAILTGLKLSGRLDGSKAGQRLWAAWQQLLALAGLAGVPQVCGLCTAGQCGGCPACCFPGLLSEQWRLSAATRYNLPCCAHACVAPPRPVAPPPTLPPRPFTSLAGAVGHVPPRLHQPAALPAHPGGRLRAGGPGGRRPPAGRAAGPVGCHQCMDRHCALHAAARFAAGGQLHGELDGWRIACPSLVLCCLDCMPPRWFKSALPAASRLRASTPPATACQPLPQCAPSCPPAPRPQDPASLQGLSLATILLAMCGNALMVPRALWTRDWVWLTGCMWGSLCFGWAQLLRWVRALAYGQAGTKSACCVAT